MPVLQTINGGLGERACHELGSTMGVDTWVAGYGERGSLPASSFQTKHWAQDYIYPGH